MTAHAGTPRLRSRLLLSIGSGLVAGEFVVLFYFRAGPLAVSDWDATWVGAKPLLRGWSPYAVITTPPWPWHLNYPLPAVMLTVSFTPFPLHIARVLFAGVGTALR